jgi:uncharacterized protein
MGTQLRQFLSAPERPAHTLNYPELCGFLFAVASAPELLKPSEWLPLIFDDRDANYASMEEAKAILQDIMELYNQINEAVFEGKVRLPEDIAMAKHPPANLDEAAPLAQWSRGFLNGHNWLVGLWDAYTPKDLDEELGSCLMMLSFFADKKLAEAYCKEVQKKPPPSVEEMAHTVVDLFEGAMANYAHLGRSIQAVLAEQTANHPYVRQEKVGRNDPCPCDSGKKYKHCCLH